LNIKYSIAKNISNFVDLILPNSISGLRILMYHSIGNNFIDDPNKLFTVSADLFISHINILKTLPECNIFDISKIGEPLDFNQLNVSITFDDGFKDLLYTVAPILNENNIPFTVFIVKDFVLNNKFGYLNEAELKELSKLDIVTIGSHGGTHNKLAELSELDLINELNDSKKYIEDLIGNSVRCISYPHGSINNKVKNAVCDIGYEYGFSSKSNINKNHKNPLMLSRTVILANDNSKIFTQKLRGAWDWRGYVK